MQVKRLLLQCIFLLMLIPTSCFPKESNEINESLGIFNFNLNDHSTWTTSPVTFKKVTDILSMDGIRIEPSFAFENKNGAVVFGTWKELKPGVVFTAAQLNAEAPPIPKEWGISDKNIKLSYGKLFSGVDYSEFNITGMGDGKSFSRAKSLKTHGIWIDLPVTYKDNDGVHSALASLYFRGPYSESFGLIGGENFLGKIMGSFKIKSNVIMITLDEYKSELSKAQNLPIQAPVDNEVKKINNIEKSFLSATAPIFLLTVTAALIVALAVRLASIIDRARWLNVRLLNDGPENIEAGKKELKSLSKRGLVINIALIFLVCCAFQISATVFLLFLDNTVYLFTEKSIMWIFLGGIFTFTLALVMFLIDALLATYSLLSYDSLKNNLLKIES